MSVMQNDTFAVGSTQVIVPASGASFFPVVIKPPAGTWGGQLKIYSGGGTLMIAPNAGAAGVSIGGATGTLLGYPIGASEIYQWAGPAAFYLQATGATMVAAVVFNFTSGYTLLL